MGHTWAPFCWYWESEEETDVMVYKSSMDLGAKSWEKIESSRPVLAAEFEFHNGRGILEQM